MKFVSTRGGDSIASAGQAISYGIAEDGGLYIPESFPKMTEDDLNQMLEYSYAERTAYVLSKFLSDYNYEELKNACEKAYESFEGDDPAPLIKIDENLYVLELFHGPTSAFKDMALTVLPYLLRKGCDLNGIKEDVLILVATSGDTGKAALEGFKDADGIKIMVFYPSEGVSKMQKLQMQTQEGDNVYVTGIKGNFDDCQTAVKQIFTSTEYKKLLKEKNVVLSSANSINFGRLAPQIAYYFSAYCDMVTSEQIKIGDKINFSVPTGNFGNILAAYYAMQMGLPINKLICASNKNNVLTDFFLSGSYNINRSFFKTMSPSMDILISSNLERLLYEISGRDSKKTNERMEELKSTGKYNITPEERATLSEVFYANYCNEDNTVETIYDFFEDYNYPLDTHTAVAVSAYDSYKHDTKDKTPTVIVSTASPYKFSQDVLYAITGNDVNDSFKASKRLMAATAMPVPDNLIKLKEKLPIFNDIAEREDIFNKVLEFIKK
jgi:threonine synthase